MESLLPEMAAKIAQYLTVKDLAACCQVSTTMRELFGSDEVWRPRCDPDYEEYLKTTPCRVKPKLGRLEVDNSTLSPVGKWRTVCRREAHLWNNWKHMRNIMEEISTESSYAFFINNDHIIAHIDGFIHLINVCEKLLHVAKLFTGRTQFVSAVQSDKFVTWGWENTVQVIRVDWESYTLSVENTFCVSEEPGTSYYYIASTVLVGFKSDSVRIWDLQSTTKLKTEDYPKKIRYLSKVDHDVKCENVCVVADSESEYHLFLYSLKDRKFWPFAKSFPEGIFSVAIVDDCVALITGSIDQYSIEIYNYHKSECLHIHQVYGSDVHAVGNSFIYINSDYLFVKHSLATGKVTCIDSFAQCHPHPINLQRVSDKIFRVGVWKKNYPVMYIESIECERLWKITRTSAVCLPNKSFFTGSNTARVIVNQACSKLLIFYCGEPPAIRLHTYW